MKAHLARSPESILGQFLEGINQAEGGARHMVHHHQDSRWFPIVAVLESVKKLCIEQAINPMMTPKPKPESTKVII